MATSRAPSSGFEIAITVIALIFSLTMSKSVLAGESQSTRLGKMAELDIRVVQEMKKVIGSRPPACVNKCLNCRPCVATLVISVRQMKGSKIPSREEDDSYYLLSWKCRCGEKLYQP